MNLQRRTFLRTAGVTIALPLFGALAPRHARAATSRSVPRRMVCVCAPLGFYPPNFFPEKAGREYDLTPYLEIVSEYRDDFTVISGLVLVAMGVILGSWMAVLQAYQNVAMRQQQLQAQKAEFRKQADDFEHKEYLRNQIKEGERLESTRVSRRTASIYRITQSTVKNNR